MKCAFFDRLIQQTMACSLVDKVGRVQYHKFVRFRLAFPEHEMAGRAGIGVCLVGAKLSIAAGAPNNHLNYNPHNFGEHAVVFNTQALTTRHTRATGSGPRRNKEIAVSS